MNVIMHRDTTALGGESISVKILQRGRCEFGYAQGVVWSGVVCGGGLQILTALISVARGTCPRNTT